MSRLRALSVSLAVVLAGSVASATGSFAHPKGIPAQGVISAKNMQWVNNQVNAAGNSLDFFERLESNGAFTRYAVAATSSGFEIIDITDPTEPTTVGHYVTAGVNYHPWVQVNPRRNIVAYSIEEQGLSVNNGVAPGVEFVNIADVTNPTFLGAVGGLGGPHTIRMIGDNYVYTTLPTHILDYTDPTHPKDLGQNEICGHEFAEDPNIPGRTYVGFCGNFKWGILDTSDPANPHVITEVRDLDVLYGHEVFPSPDSSFVGVTDFRIGPATGYTYTQCPGGGIHFYDISGKYVPGASLLNPKKMGAWFAPFNTIMPADPDPTSSHPSWASCTTHSWQMPPERMIFAAGTYTAGTWIGDPTAATKQTGGAYTEWKGNPNHDPTGTQTMRGLGPTTWGNTIANFLAEGDFVNASQWLPFDVTSDPDAGRYVFTNGLVRGFDILKYTGTLPKKISRLRVDSSAQGGAVTGVLDRYAVLTYQGWVNKPLEGRSIEVSAGGTTVTVTTAADGSFSAPLGLGPGAHQVTVTWAGDDVFAPVQTTQTVQA